jgi:2-haloacid dehalogenase
MESGEMKKYDIFLFDADNTLYNYDKAEAHALKAMFDYFGFEYSESQRTIYREINSQAWRDYEEGKISKADLQTVRFERFFKKINVWHDPCDFNTRYLAELGRGTFLVDGALEICNEIVSRDKQIFIVTNGILATQESRIKHSLIKEYVSDFFVSEFVGFQKPDIEYFSYVFTHIPKIPKNKILIVGDSLTADIAGGNNAGIDSCWFNEHGIDNTTDIKPTYEIRNLSEVLKFV